MMIPKRVKLALRLASDIAPKLPGKGDSLLQIVVKALSIVDSAEKILNPGKMNALASLIERYDLVEKKSQQFVSLFFDTKLQDEFEIQRYALEDYLDVIEAKSDKFGRIFFTEYNYGSTREPEETFFHTKGFDFQEVLSGLWDAYEGRLHVTLTTGRYGCGTISKFATFHATPNPLYGSMHERMEKLVTKHRRFMLDGVPRTYMFYGKAGTGKTSFAVEFADRLHGRVLNIDAVSLGFATVQDISFLLDSLQPDFFLIDDIDKADVQKTVPTVLAMLARFKTEHPKTSVLLTSNAVENFDPGFLRPNRIDTWEHFELPDPDERRILLSRYFEELKVNHDPGLLSRLVDETGTLSQDYLREIAGLFKYEEADDIFKKIVLMRKLLESNANAAKEEKNSSPTPNKAVTNGVVLKAAE